MRYDDNTLKYYDKLSNIGEFDKSLEDNIGVGIVGSPMCGDVMKLQILFDENGKIIDAKCKVFGCVSAIASMEYTCDALKGKTIEEAKALTNEEVANSLNLTPIKKHCSVLAKEAVHAAIENYIKKKVGILEHIFIEITDKAIAKIKELINNEEHCIGISIDVQNGGCSGIEYYLSYQTEEDLQPTSDNVKESQTKDKEREEARLLSDTSDTQKKSIKINDINFFYLEKYETLIDGIKIDIVENDFGYSFIISNPNQNTGTCENCTCKCG